LTISDVLIEQHERTNGCLNKLLDHCSTLTDQELNRELDGFGLPTVRLQLHHVLISARYWTGVLEGRIEADNAPDAHLTVESLQRLHETVVEAGHGYLSRATDDELTTPRPMTTWGHEEQTLVPARIFMRMQTHLFHHQGQVLAMCRMLGRPGKGLDYPVT